MFRLKALLGSLDALLQAPETTTLERLRVREQAASVGRGCCVPAQSEGSRTRHNRLSLCVLLCFSHLMLSRAGRGLQRDDHRLLLPPLPGALRCPVPPRVGWHGMHTSVGMKWGGLPRRAPSRARPPPLLTRCLSTFAAHAPSSSSTSKQGGIFFDRSLGTTSRLFAFVMRMLATGACVRAWGGGCAGAVAL